MDDKDILYLLDNHDKSINNLAVNVDLICKTIMEMQSNIERLETEIDDLRYDFKMHVYPEEF